MPAKDAPKTVCLALQGGGAHAAFGWGALDRLLDEVAAGRLRIVAISGTSGGALNGAACTAGLNQSAAQARQRLTQLWESVAGKSYWSPALNWPLAASHSPREWNVDYNPFVIVQGMAQQVSSPYLTPWLRDEIGTIMDAVIGDYGLLQHPDGQAPQLFVAATNVTRTSLRIFGPPDLASSAPLMASTCFPTLFEAVEIDGEFYWDGGYMANPALDPLLAHGDDLLTVLIDPLVIDGPPTWPRQIVNRINEVSFGASWVLAVRQIGLVNDLIVRGLLTGGGYTQKRFQVIRDDAPMNEIGAASKDTPSLAFFRALRDAGARAADRWVEAHFDDIGVRSSFDLDDEVKQRLKGTRQAQHTAQ
ncbi:patatin-like phospholipase family protein [Paraburkholderia hospita]|uniref:patatin-like phospholipase family protein n=1 Tax=Paraburkholderia hospita TaxID=169430 RepID=UPI003ECDAC62